LARSRSRSSIAPLADPSRNCASLSIVFSLVSIEPTRCTCRLRVMRSELIMCISACVEVVIAFALVWISRRSAFSRVRREWSARSLPSMATDLPERCVESMPLLAASSELSSSCCCNCSCCSACS